MCMADWCDVPSEAKDIGLPIVTVRIVWGLNMSPDARWDILTSCVLEHEERGPCSPAELATRGRNRWQNDGGLDFAPPGMGITNKQGYHVTPTHQVGLESLVIALRDDLLDAEAKSVRDAKAAICISLTGKEFADALMDGMSVEQAAEQCHIPRASAYRKLNSIRTLFGA